MAQSGHPDTLDECPLLGVKRACEFMSTRPSFTLTVKDCGAKKPIGPPPLVTRAQAGSASEPDRDVRDRHHVLDVDITLGLR